MMKKIISIVVLVVAGTAVSFAQCDKKIILTSSTTEYLDSNNVVERSVTEKSTIKIDKSSSSLIISPGNDHEMKGTITGDSCDWRVPYKEGKSIIKAVIKDESGDVKNATLTIEGKEGQITVIVAVAEMPDRTIRVPIDTFQEER